ncbi:MAG: glycoside hydrolase family 127 protein, partial [Anaerolineaceae bacterium]|nr:glycoside hydrolase family 127 protein [Anaerolineaceae bacterium]
WCCHCTLLQANAGLHESIFYRDAGGVAVCQYLPAEVTLPIDATQVKIVQQVLSQSGENLRILPVNRDLPARPDLTQVSLRIEAAAPVEFTLRLRCPWWLKADLVVEINGEACAWEADGSGFACIRRTWQQDEVRVTLARGLTAWPLPDRPDSVAFLDGPVVLAGLVGEERLLYGDIADPSSMLAADDEREWQSWKRGWRTVNQPVGWKFKPLYEIGNEVYTVYFPVLRPAPSLVQE